MRNIFKVIDIIYPINASQGNFILRTERKNINFNPGQFFSIGIPNEPINREYSVTSGKNDNYLDFLIREIKDGTLSTKLKKLKKNDEIKILGPYGEFYLKEYDMSKNYFFIASGTGLAPFLSLIKSNPELNYYLFHGVRNYCDLFLEYSLKNYKGFVSREYDNRKINKIEIFKGRITENLDKIKNYFSKNSLYFLCGNNEMVNEMYNNLTKMCIKDEQIFSEIFF